jgi:uncharacterized OB-fold protein
VPYVIAIVKTDEGPHLLSRVVGVAPEAVKIGMKVRAEKVTPPGQWVWTGNS